MELAQIDQLLARGELVPARDALNALLARTPRHRDALTRAIDVHAALQAPADALRHAQALHALDPKNLDGQFYLAKSELASGNLARAEELIAQLANTAANGSAAFQLLRGNLYLAQQLWPEAEVALAHATKLDPNLAMAFANLGEVLRRLGKTDGARAALMRAAQLNPQSPEAWTALASLHHALGAVADAQSCYERALGLDARVPATWFALGNLLVETFNFPHARQCFERVLTLEPTHEGGRSVLGFVLNEIGETSGARDVLDTSDQPTATFSRRVRDQLLLPQIYESAEDLTQWRQRYRDGLAVLATADINPNDVWSLSQPNFLLAYQGQNDRALQMQYADFLRGMIARSRPDLLVSPKRVANGKRIKVVFVSSFFRECTVGHYFRSWITDLDAKKFERVVIHTGWQLDAFGAALETQCDQLIIARGGVLQTAEAIRAQAADIIIYPEVGMGAQNYLLTNMRLAPIQIAAWGHPVTTGSSEIDYFLSCGEMEPANAAEHYRERLLMLPGIGTNYALPPTSAAIKRDALGIAPDRHVYICPQSLFKIHPDNDATYVDLMARDDKAVLLFFQSPHAPVTQAFSQRLARQMAAHNLPPREQIKFLPRMDEAGFRAVVAMADVMLDTLHWSGGNTSLDALAVGTPIITLPGEFMRGRQTQAMLSAMGMDELVVANRDAYVAGAIAVARDGGWRARVLANRGAVFGRCEAVAALSEHLQEVVEAGRG